jgi:hypothetical protein
MVPYHIHNATWAAWSARSTLAGDDRIALAWEEPWNGSYRTHFTVQTPPSPDLEVAGDSIRMGHCPGLERPFSLNFTIRNVGKGTAKAFKVTVMLENVHGEEVARLGPFYWKGELASLTNASFEPSGVVPSGYIRARIVIEETEPFEYNLGNNAFSVWLLVPNNWPSVEVTHPEDGAVFHEELVIRGHTFDADGPEGVHTWVHGPGELSCVVNGTGNWEIVIDLTDMPSGDYMLRVWAVDWEVWTEPVHVWIRVDHLVDTLTVTHIDPEGDVELLVGNGITMSMGANDTFGRPLVWTWSLDGIGVGASSPNWYFHATAPGFFAVRCEVTNGLHTVSNGWNVTVRTHVKPSFMRQSPDAEVTVLKGETVDFRAELVNPDKLPTTLSWSVNGHAVEAVDGLAWSTAFVESGLAAVSVHGFHSGGATSLRWNVTVLNRAPIIESILPDETSFVIVEERILDLEVLVSDPDDDPLTYTWGSDVGEVVSAEDAWARLRCPCDDDEPYYLWVIVSDGEDPVRVEWTVDPVPPLPNRPPVLDTVFPLNSTVTIGDDTFMAFGVNATDPDADGLTFLWTSSLMDPMVGNLSSCELLLPFSKDGAYTVRVEVTDGEYAQSHEWIVESVEPDEPANHTGGEFPWTVVAIVVVAAVAATLAYIYHERRRGGGLWY